MDDEKQPKKKKEEFAAAYFLRWVPPKTFAFGEIVHVFSSANKDLKLDDYREAYPEHFQKPGFYTLMKSVGNTTVDTQSKQN